MIRDSELTVCSLNVRGLVDNMKRRETFRWLRMKKLSIFFLQEVHSSSEMENDWANEWGYTAIYGSCSNSRGGVPMLFNNNFNFEILKKYCDTEGRFIILNTKTNDKILT